MRVAMLESLLDKKVPFWLFFGTVFLSALNILILMLPAIVAKARRRPGPSQED